VVAQAFAEELKYQNKVLSEYLIQVLPQGKYPRFRGGHIIQVIPGVKEWTESVRYADAVILIGGLGGTYETYMFAMQEQKPVWPIASTGGDSQRAYTDLLEHWSLQPIQEIDEDKFQSQLTVPILSEEDAQRVSWELLELITQYFQQEEKAKRDRIFISYSHNQQDKRWLAKLRLIIKPLERQKGYYIWDDTAIEAGQRWKEEIERALDATKVAIFLVSPHFIASQFITDHELPPLLRAAENAHVTILWIYLSACLYEETGLKDIQAAHDISRPLDGLTPAKQNQVLVAIAKKIKAAMEHI
jgi:hypothetical protein